jgi:uncharacterized surface protein with fasciclin (FAS1) repeats
MKAQKGDKSTFRRTCLALSAATLTTGPALADGHSKDIVETAVEGSEATIGTMSGITVDDANVVRADIEASNGVTHVIDGVIIPE